MEWVIHTNIYTHRQGLAILITDGCYIDKNNKKTISDIYNTQVRYVCSGKGPLAVRLEYIH